MITLIKDCDIPVNFRGNGVNFRFNILEFARFVQPLALEQPVGGNQVKGFPAEVRADKLLFFLFFPVFRFFNQAVNAVNGFVIGRGDLLRLALKASSGEFHFASMFLRISLSASFSLRRRARSFFAASALPSYRDMSRQSLTRSATADKTWAALVSMRPMCGARVFRVTASAKSKGPAPCSRAAAAAVSSSPSAGSSSIYFSYKKKPTRR
jgi:hypothetical protein